MKKMFKRFSAFFIALVMLAGVCCPTALAGQIMAGENGQTIYLSWSYYAKDGSVYTPVPELQKDATYRARLSYAGNPTELQKSIQNFDLCCTFNSENASVDNANKVYKGIKVGYFEKNLIGNEIRLSFGSPSGIYDPNDEEEKIISAGSVVEVEFTANETITAQELHNLFQVNPNYAGMTMLDGDNQKFTIVEAPVFTASAKEGTTIYPSDTEEAVAQKLTGTFIDASGTSTVVDVTSVTFKGALTEGENVVTASYEYEGVTYTCDVTINVTADTLTKIEVTTQPKLNYDSGEALDLSDMVVTATYASTQTKVLTEAEYTTSPEEGTVLKIADSGSTVTITADGQMAETNALTVAPKSVKIPVVAGIYTYNGEKQEFGFEEGTDADSSYYTLSPAAEGQNAGTYTVTASLNDKTETSWANNTTGDITLTWTIAQKEITPTIAGISDQQYTGEPIKPEITVKDGETPLTEDDYTVSYGENINVGENNGSVTVKAAENGNYTFQDVTAHFNIVAQAGSISIVAKEAEYTGSAYAESNIEVSKNNATANVTFTYYTDADATERTTAENSGAASEGAAPKNAGTYYVKASMAASGNYGAATSNAEPFTIIKKALTITADNQSITFGEAVPTYTFTAKGYVGEDDDSVVTANFACDYTQGGNAGTYTITVTADAANYEITCSSGTLTVAKKTLTANELTASETNPTKKEYDGTTELAGVTYQVTINKQTYTVDGKAAFADKDVGTGKLVTFTPDALDNTNYAFADGLTMTFTADITAKALTVTGLTATDRAYDGTTNVTLTGGELANVISGDEVFAEMPTSGTVSDPDASETPKTVLFNEITLTGTDAGNYTLTQPNVTVTISKATPELGTVSYTGSIYPTTLKETVTLTSEATVSGSLKLDDTGAFNTVGTAEYAYAFGYCGSLESITIPRNITSIGNYAFKDCSNLESAHFCGNAPDIWPSTFSGCKNTFCIYYMPGTSGWTDSSAYDAAAGTWNGYPLKIWDGKIVPEETKLSVPTGKYCIQVIDESGAPINDATVWWNGSRASTEENGNVFVDLVTVGEPVIRVVKSGYIEWTNKYSNWKKSETRFERVILYPESHGSLKLKSAKLGKCDLLTQTKVLNLRNDGALIGDLNSGHFDLTCAATDSSVVTGYALYQNTKKIAESADGSFTKLDVRDFVEGGGCFVRVAGTNGQTMDTHINLQFAKNSVNEDFKLELKDNHISFDVSDDVPYIGGTTISVDLPLEVPVVVSATTDKMKFGINLKLNPDKSEEEQIDSYIKTIKKAVVAEGVNLSKANAKALKNCAAQHNKAKFFKDFDITVCGYAEADFGSNTASGYMLFIVDWQLVDYEYNTVIIIPIAPPLAVPITVQVGAELSLEAGATVSYKLDARTWNGNVVLNPSVGLTPFAGIGYGRVAGIGVYGNADLNAKINLWGKNSGCQAVDLTGEFGAKGYFGPLEWTKAFAHQTWHLYTANTVSSLSLLNVAPAWNAAPEASDFEVSDLSYLAEESAWAPASPQIYRTSRTAQLKASYQMLLQNTYRNAQPVMISDGSALYAAFVRADANTGARYVALSKFDGTNWSEPVRIDTSAILDNAPQLCTDGQKLWLAYARTTQEPDDSLVSYAQHQNIVVGTVNKDTLAFAEQKIYQSDEYMHLPTLSCVNGTPVLAWAESAVTDMDSVIMPKNSTVYLAKYQNGAWTQVEQTAASASVIDSICIGARNGAPTVAYTADGKLYCGGSILSESVTGRAVYGRLPGTAADSFLWNANGALHNEAGDTVPTEDMGRDFVIVGSSIYYNQSNGASANLAALHYDAANDHWSAPILLIGDERYLENLNAAELNGKTYALGLHTTVTISEDDVNDAKDLVWTQILPISDLKLSDVSFDADALVPGEMIPVTLTVTNSGDHTVSSLTLVADGAGTAQDCQLLPGESAEFTVNIICPSEKQTVTFEVQEPRQGDYTPEDNTSSCTVGSADAEIELALVQIGSRKLVQAAVVNRGLEAASGSVLFTDSDGQILAERTFQNLRYGDAVIAEYEPDSFADLYGKDVNATVVLQQDERNTLNNSDSVPVLFLASTQITAAYQSGNALKAEVCCAEPAKAVCAFYDQYGKMLDVQMQSLQTEKVNTLSFDIKDARTKIAKIFVLDTGSASPVCAAWNVTVE